MWQEALTGFVGRRGGTISKLVNPANQEGWSLATMLLSTWQMHLGPYNLLHQKCQTYWKKAAQRSHLEREMKQ